MLRAAFEIEAVAFREAELFRAVELNFDGALQYV